MLFGWYYKPKTYRIHTLHNANVFGFVSAAAAAAATAMYTHARCEANTRQLLCTVPVCCLSPVVVVACGSFRAHLFSIFNLGNGSRVQYSHAIAGYTHTRQRFMHIRSVCMDVFASRHTHGVSTRARARVCAVLILISASELDELPRQPARVLDAAAALCCDTCSSSFAMRIALLAVVFAHARA